MLIGRPSLPNIDLDLVEVSGGGEAPTQFFGKTADGSPVHIRYRGGRLTIDKGLPGNDDAANMAEVYAARFGPPLHGMIRIEQISDLTGLTVRGERLTLTDEKWRAASDEDRVIDFSGKRRYFEEEIYWSETEYKIFRRLLKQKFQGAVEVDFSFEGNQRRSAASWTYADYATNFRDPNSAGAVPLLLPTTVPVDVGPISPRRLRVVEDGQEDANSPLILLDPARDLVKALSAMEHVALPELADACALVVDIRSGRHAKPTGPSPQASGHQIALPDGSVMNIELPAYGPGGISTAFEVARADCVVAFAALMRCLEQQFADDLEEVDLMSGVSRPNEESKGQARYSREMKAWCEAKPNRFIGIHTYGDHPLGYRPIR